MKFCNGFAVLVLGATLAGCASGPPRRVSPPTASIQQLAAQADGTWRLTLRIQNFSNVPMTFGALKASLEVAGANAGTVALTPDLEIPGESADVVDATIRSAAKLPAGDFAYELKGTIDTSEPKGHYDFHRSSRLSPVPGVPDTWR